MRALIWVQHLLGTGHTVRAAALARALAGRDVAVTLALGAPAPATLDLAGLDVVALPPVAATDATFKTILAPDGTPYAALAAERARELVALAAAAPDIVLTETFPFGRRPFRLELLPMLEALPARAVVAASVRDVLVRKEAEKERAMAALARRFYDVVLVHADPRFVRLADSFAHEGEIADLIRYTGFVHAIAPPAGEVGEGGEVVVSAGGSGVGAAIVEAALGAARRGRHRWRILVPAALAERLPAWRAAAPANAVVEGNRADFRALLSGAALSVSQAGYNTALDVLEARVRAVFIPFAAHEETEQTARAEALARRGLARVLPEAALSAGTLAAAVAVALADPPPVRPALDVDGAARAADILVAMARGRR